ncbi:solute carrier family 25 member 36-A-like [Halichondria panicea]|uniref:solute carrier family 25 member 36-A-like n=1 Tax=Halichondria panicea TaxID=6063 RepID=UPI00312BBD83
MTDPVINLLAGGLAGAVGTMVTCPLEVIKTRLQSSVGQNVLQNVQLYRVLSLQTASAGGGVAIASTTPLVYFRHMLQTEGLSALFKGLSPSLIGIMPTRALYFTSYAQAKQMFNNIFSYESPAVHLCSAVSAGVVTSTVTSPIWVVKTQMQLECSRLTAQRCVKQIFKMDGIRGFYRGLTASYAGLSETAIHFVIYEHIKKTIKAHNQTLELKDCMLAAGISKLTASSICYPHEVCRTRLRQKVAREHRKYHSFFQTLLKISREEGTRGLYGGMTPHLCRVVPNTVIVFLTYEAIIRMVQESNN